MTFWEYAFRVALAAGAVIQTAFVVVYATRPWRNSPISKALMNKSAMLCLCLLAVEVHFYVRPLPVWLWAVLSALLTFAIARQFWVMVRAQHYEPPHP